VLDGSIVFLRPGIFLFLYTVGGLPHLSDLYERILKQRFINVLIWFSFFGGLLGGCFMAVVQNRTFVSPTHVYLKPPSMPLTGRGDKIQTMLTRFQTLLTLICHIL
jgi:hypothetical protein